MTFAEQLADFKKRHDMTLPVLAELIGSKPRALEYWLSPTKPKEPRDLAKRAVLATLDAYDRKHKPKNEKCTTKTESLTTPSSATAPESRA